MHALVHAALCEPCERICNGELTTNYITYLSYRHCFDVLRLGHPLMPLGARSEGPGHHRARCLHRGCLHNSNEEISDAKRREILFI